MTDTVAPVAPVAEPAPRVVRFVSGAMKANLSGLVRSEWIQTLGEFETFEDCLDPNAYRNVMAQNNKPARRDKVCVYSHDGRDYREYLVVAADKAWLKLQPIVEMKSDKVEAPDIPALSLKWNVGQQKYQIVRKGDNSVLKDSFQTKEAAITWMAEHAKAMAA